LNTSFKSKLSPHRLANRFLEAEKPHRISGSQS
jgi:hypothetical protein